MVLLKAAKDIDNKQGVYAKLLATSHRRKFCTSVIKENKKIKINSIMFQALMVISFNVVF